MESPSATFVTSRGSVRRIDPATISVAISFCTLASIPQRLRGRGGARCKPLADELVAEAVNGEEEFGRLRVGFDLLAQARHVDVDGSRQRRLVVAPHLGEQLVARERGAAVFDE